MDRLFCEFLCVHLPWKHLPWYDGICRSLWPDAYYYLAFLKFVRNMISWVTGIFLNTYIHIFYTCVPFKVFIRQAWLILFWANAPTGHAVIILTWNSGHVGVGWLKTTYSSQKQIHGLYPNKHQNQHVYTCLHLKLLTTSTVADHHPKIRLFSRNHAIEHDPGRSQHNQDQHIQHEG